MEEHFKAGDFATGIIQGIGEISLLLKKHFPIKNNDLNELSNKPVILP